MEQKDNLYKMRHSCAHLYAYAVRELWPDVQITIGPPIEDGFYYDVDMKHHITDEDLKIIEKKMKHLKKQYLEFVIHSLPIDEAIRYMKKQKWDYKVEMAEDLKEEGVEEISFCKNVDKDGNTKFEDMCEGAHLENMNKIGAFKLAKVAGAYWRGDEKNKMLQRVYGYCFEKEEELQDHLKMLREAEKRDHRKLGKELEIFTFDDEVGPGLPLWLPNGAIIIEELETLAKKKEKEFGYQLVRTPHVAKEQLYIRSGHLPYYKDSMFPKMKYENEVYYLKAMNCPHHHKIYSFRPRSYRELPLRLAEYGVVYRFEDSGALFGLMRTRSLSMNDAHIYCTEEQFEEEFLKVLDLYKYYFKLFGIEKYEMTLALHSKEGLGGKYVDNEKLWLKTEEQVRRAMKKSKIPFTEVSDEAAFYGPKIDVQIWSAIGREFTLATNQLDFAQPEKFNLRYIDKDGKEKTPICIHRAPLGTHERFIGFLIEHFAGAFPLWLAPEQIRIVPVADVFNKYAEEIKEMFEEEGFRISIDDSNESMGKKIRNAEKMKIPRIFVLGEKEQKGKSIAERNYFTKAQKVKKAEKVLKELQKIRDDKVIEK